MKYVRLPHLIITDTWVVKYDRGCVQVCTRNRNILRNHLKPKRFHSFSQELFCAIEFEGNIMFTPLDKSNKNTYRCDSNLY